MGSQIGSHGGNSTGDGHPIKIINTDSGPGAQPLAGVVNVVGGTNVNTSDVGNNAVISLNDDITITSADIGNVSVSGNTVGSTTGNLILDPNGSGKTQVNYLNPNSVAIRDSNEYISDIGSMTDGQILIGSTGSEPVASTLTAGSGISVSNGPGSITISSQGNSAACFGVNSWEKISYDGTTAQVINPMEPNKGYVCNAWGAKRQSGGYNLYPILIQLPPTDDLSVGDIVSVAAVGGAGVQILLQEDQQVIYNNGGYVNRVVTQYMQPYPLVYPWILRPFGSFFNQVIHLMVVGKPLPGYTQRALTWYIYNTSLFWTADKLLSGRLKMGPL